ncbi:hypothetical protein [Longibaculum muris]|uniref:hypothetical protein n=1 Tax=Longibaculum muris TaxID=1796628 RepID=UPI0022DEBB1A|nr:hypothetical protein [Longibaculum muris]
MKLKKAYVEGYYKIVVLELFDLYVGFEKFKNTNIERILIHALNFDKKELQS